SDFTSYQTLLDPTGIKAYILKRGHKVGAGPALLGHATTVYQADRKGNSIEVWLADDLSLPLRIAGHSAKGSQFAINITHLDLHPAFGRHEFDERPPGYQEIKAQPAGAGE
ncbi:MAG: hypothetical protein KGR26_03740, partial [Cyanobacteria bacterium REEB65]|nr:hypothetical protein [Cyanobacteria bacterium REEB65]